MVLSSSTCFSHIHSKWLTTSLPWPCMAYPPSMQFQVTTFQGGILLHSQTILGGSHIFAYMLIKLVPHMFFCLLQVQQHPTPAFVTWNNCLYKLVTILFMVFGLLENLFRITRMLQLLTVMSISINQVQIRSSQKKIEWICQNAEFFFSSKWCFSMIDKDYLNLSIFCLFLLPVSVFTSAAALYLSSYFLANDST